MGGFNDWSVTPASNSSVGSMNWPEGQLPSTVNNSARQMAADLRYELGAISSAISAGATTDLGSVQEGVVVLSGSATITRFGATGTAGLRKKLRFTGTPTLQHSTGGIICPGSADITIAAGDTCEVICESSDVWRIYNYQRADGAPLVGSGAPTDAQYVVLASSAALTNERVLSAGDGASLSTSSSGATIAVDSSYLRSYLSGLGLSNNGTDANNDVDIAVGVAVDSTNAKFLKLTSALTKQLDAAWAVGTNQGGLDTGAKANSTWYHVWLILRSDTGVVDALFSTSATSPTMPANYDYKRRIGAVLTDGSGNIRAFKQTGDWFQWVTSIQDVDTSNGNTTSRSLRTMSSPLGVKCRVKLRAYVADANDSVTILQDPEETDAAPNKTMTPPGGDLNNTSNSQQIAVLEVQTDTSSQVATRCSAASKPLDIVTFGYWDYRGRDD